MISQLRPIETRDFQIPTAASPFSFESFAFLFFNVMSLGLYGTIQSLAKERVITELHLKQQHLQTQAARIFEQFEGLNEQIHTLRSRLNRDETGDLVALEIDRLEQQSIALRAIVLDVENLPAQDRQITQMSVPFIQFVGVLLSNIVTVGLYGMIQNANQDSCIATLEAHNEKIKEVINEKKNVHLTGIQSQLDTLRTHLRMSQERKELMQSEAGQVFSHKKEAEKNASRLVDERKELAGNLLALQGDAVRLGEAQRQLTDSVTQTSQEMEVVAQRNMELRAERAREINGVSITQLQRYKNRLQREAERAQSVFNDERNLNLELLGVRQVPLNDDVQRAHLGLGPIPSRCPGSGEIIGDYGLDVEDCDEELWTDYTKRYAGKKTAFELVSTALETAFDDLLKMAGQENPKINWNTSTSLWYDTEAKYTENKNALYRHMVWEFISHGSLIQVDQESYVLRLNNEGVTMASSLPVRCQSIREITAEDGSIQRVPEVHVLPTVIDEFTPAIGDMLLRFGIDPVSAKRIFNQLSDEEKGHLQNLLLDPLIANEHADLLNTRLFMRNGSPERVKLVRDAYELICDIGVAIEKKFDKKGLGQLLGGLADDYDLEPFHKEEVQAPVVTQTAPVVAPIVEWTPDTESLKVKTKSGASTQTDFATAIENSVALYKKIYAGMSAKVIDNPDNILYSPYVQDKNVGNITVKGITNQFTYKHPMYGGHGCLMSAITSVLMTDASKANSTSVQHLKNAMAAYLSVKENAKLFASKIAGNHYGSNRPHKLERMTDEQYEKAIEKWLEQSVESYQSWLKYGGSIYNGDLGDVEIEIIACMIGVRIAVFYDGQATKLNEYGLTIPADERFYYGPNTKETLYLYNSSQSTYAGLWPKMKVNAFETDELKRTAASLSTYVTTFAT